MRVIGEVPHKHYKITLFQWNGKFLIKIESGLLEQTYKVDEWDIAENELPELLDDDFLQTVTHTFNEMHKNFGNSLNRH